MKQHVFRRAREVPALTSEQIGERLAGSWRDAADSKRWQTAPLETNTATVCPPTADTSSVALADFAPGWERDFVLRKKKKGARADKEQAHAPESLVRVAVVIDVARRTSLRTQMNGIFGRIISRLPRSRG
jgi:hypothetical protein